MSEPKRYDYLSGGGDLVPTDDGEWVRYEDVEALRAQVAGLTREWRQMADALTMARQVLRSVALHRPEDIHDCTAALNAADAILTLAEERKP